MSAGDAVVYFGEVPTNVTTLVYAPTVPNMIRSSATLTTSVPPAAFAQRVTLRLVAPSFEIDQARAHCPHSAVALPLNTVQESVYISNSLSAATRVLHVKESLMM
jgi:hypothetical protein